MFDESSVRFFPWNDAFETGHPLIDEQHKTLIELLNKLANTLAHAEPMAVHKAIEELAHYADFHFKSEEAIWANYFEDDAWFVTHKKQHESFLPEALELKKTMQDRPSEEVVEEILKFIIHWLAIHIIDEDKRLALVIDEMKQGTPLEKAKSIANDKLAGSFKILIEAIMDMYDGLSSRILHIMRERNARAKVEDELRKANQKLEEANAQLEQLSITDQLTGLYNRRHFDNIIKVELNRAQRDRNSLILVSFDIDFFKKLNDHYGHSIGDKALMKVGQELKKVCRRSSDFSFRLGGEEFAVITTNQNNKDGLKFGERIRKHIEDLKVPNINSKVSDYMTVSVGVVVANSETGYDPEGLMKVVDQRLYVAKDLGRNQVVAD